MGDKNENKRVDSPESVAVYLKYYCLGYRYQFPKKYFLTVCKKYFHFPYSVAARGWSGGAKVLGKLPVPGRPTSFDDGWARAYCACSRCGWGFVWTFFLSSSFSLFFLPLFGRRPDID